MCEKPNSTDAVHHPANSLFDAFDSKFCNSPRNNNSSGQAVNIKIASESPAYELHLLHCGENAMKCNALPSGIAMHAKTTKLPTAYSPQRFPHPIEYPIPFARRTSKKDARAVFTATNTVSTCANLPSG